MGSYVAKTNSSGIADFGFIPPGTYTLVQLTAPQGYNSISPQTVIINSPDKKINLTNSPSNPRTLSITKTDQSGLPLAGQDSSCGIRRERLNLLSRRKPQLQIIRCRLGI
ncbi:MAG: Prealbumin-like fold domain [Oscillospiraceae bacterium]|jgi:uncharacterized surface anchored protein|nr:Prealbumin-like fold domain [Oscillospiraceae bacterium]